MNKEIKLANLKKTCKVFAVISRILEIVSYVGAAISAVSIIALFAGSEYLGVKIDGADQHAGVLRERRPGHLAGRPVMGGEENMVRELLAEALQQMMDRAGAVVLRVAARHAALAGAHDGIVVGQDGEAHGRIGPEVVPDIVLDVSEKRVRREAELLLVDRNAFLRIDARRRLGRQDDGKVVPPDTPVPVDAVQILRRILLLELGKMDLPVLERGRAGVGLYLRTASQQHRTNQYAYQG